MKHITNEQFRNAVWLALEGPEHISFKLARAKELLSAVLPRLGDWDILDLLENNEHEDSAYVTNALGIQRQALLDTLEPEKLTCPACGAGPLEWRYLEDIQNHRRVVKVNDDGSLVIEGAYEHGDGYDDGEKRYFECHADAGKGECLATWPIPAAVSYDFV